MMGGCMRLAANRLVSFTIALTAWCCVADGAGAADLAIKPTRMALPPQLQADVWRFTVMPYFWGPSLNGTSTIRGRTADVDLTFVDMVEHSQIPKDLFGAMAYLEARKGAWSFFSDLVYMKLAASGSAVRERSLAPGVSGDIAASAEARVKMFIGEAAVAYEFARFGPPGSQSAFDVYGGVRGWWQEASASLAISAGLNIRDLEISGNRAIARSGDVSWLDPLIGLRWRQQFSADKELMVKGDVGGFGAGSEFSWQALATFNWEFCRTESVVWKAVVGYRALSVDYSQGSGRTLYEYDMVQHGPILGVSAAF
jgi:hypothetical protein